MLSISGISVSLPDKSTAILPDEAGIKPGHPTGMDLAAILKRIDARRKEMGLSDHAVSKKAGKVDAIRNMRRALLDGGRGATINTISALERALEVEPGWLMRSNDSEKPKLAAGPADVSRLYEERRALEAERDALNRKIDGLAHAIAVLERQPAGRKRTG